MNFVRVAVKTATSAQENGSTAAQAATTWECQKMRTLCFAVLIAVIAGFAGGISAQTFVGSGTGAIPDAPGAGPYNYGAPRTISFTVSGLTNNIADVQVGFTGTHSYTGDL